MRTRGWDHDYKISRSTSTPPIASTDHVGEKSPNPTTIWDTREIGRKKTGLSLPKILQRNQNRHGELPGATVPKWQNKACHSRKLPLRFGANSFGPGAMLQRSVGKHMTKARRDGLVLLFLGATILVLLMTYLVNSTSTAAFEDFKPDYYASRCLIEHGDPYNELDVLRVYQAEGGERPHEAEMDREIATR